MSEHKENDEYYLQCGFCGNDILFWKNGRCGYTTDLDNAHVFTRDEAYRQHSIRDIDVPRKKAVMDEIAHRAVALQDIPPNSPPPFCYNLGDYQ